jgi:adenine phosphoribosyltransferase
MTTTIHQANDLKSLIREVPDYPGPGILFRDLTPLMADPGAMQYVTDCFVSHLRHVEADAIAAIDARGFIFAAPAAVSAGLPFIPFRKAGKLPPEVVGADYILEYGTSRLEARSNAVRPGQRVAIVDDLLATGGTASAAARLIAGLGATVVSAGFVVELKDLGGRKLLPGIDIFTIVEY